MLSRDCCRFQSEHPFEVIYKMEAIFHSGLQEIAEELVETN